MVVRSEYTEMKYNLACMEYMLNSLACSYVQSGACAFSIVCMIHIS